MAGIRLHQHWLPLVHWCLPAFLQKVTDEARQKTKQVNTAGAVIALPGHVNLLLPCTGLQHHHHTALVHSPVNCPKVALKKVAPPP